MDTAELTGAVAQGAIKPETFLNHWVDIRDAKSELDGTSTIVARAKKAAKRDGVDLDVLKIVEKLIKMEDDEQAVFINRLRMYSQWLKMPLGAYSMGMIVPEPKAASQADFEKWQAGQDGTRAGETGGLRADNPHAPGTAKFVAWDKGWPQGFKKHQRKLADKMVRGTGGARTRSMTNGESAGALN